MNFLAHDAVLPGGSSPLTRVGAAVPDLWPLLPRRPLGRAIVQTLRSSRDSAAQALVAGIDAHLRADACFHRHPEFLRRMRWLTPQLRSLWPGLRFPHLAAHVLVELLLDRWLIARDRGHLDRYFDCFSADNRTLAAELGAADPPSRAALSAVLERFVEIRPMADYPSPPGLARRLGQVMARAHRDPALVAPPALAPRLEGWAEALAPGSAELLGVVRAELAAA